MKRYRKLTAEEIEKELTSAMSMEDFFGKDGIMARLFACKVPYKQIWSRLLDKILQKGFTASMSRAVTPTDNGYAESRKICWNLHAFSCKKAEIGYFWRVFTGCREMDKFL